MGSYLLEPMECTKYVPHKSFQFYLPMYPTRSFNCNDKLLFVSAIFILMHSTPYFPFLNTDCKTRSRSAVNKIVTTFNNIPQKDLIQAVRTRQYLQSYIWSRLMNVCTHRAIIKSPSLSSEANLEDSLKESNMDLSTEFELSFNPESLQCTARNDLVEASPSVEIILDPTTNFASDSRSSHHGIASHLLLSASIVARSS